MTRDEWLSTFRYNLGYLMDQWGYSQEELANDTGVSQSTISNYLKGTQLPSAIAILNLSYAFNCDPSALIDFDGPVR